MSSAPSRLTPAPQMRRVSRRHCALYKLNVLTYLLTKFRRSNRIGVKFGRIVLQVNTHRLTESNFDTTSYFQPPATRSSVRWLPVSPLSARDVIGSLYALQFLIHSTFVVANFYDAENEKNDE